MKFSRDCVPLSCFSSTISCLLSTYQWKVSRKATDSTPQCLAHNIASLYDPSLPVRIVLVDVARHIQLYVESDDDDRDILPEVCSRVCRSVFGAIERVFDVMRLSELEVSPAVLCPCKSEFESHSAHHLTVLTKNYLRCSKTGNSVGRASDQHMMWLCVNTKISATAKPTSEATPTNTPVITMDALPRLPDLLKLGVPQKVGVHYRQFGTFLLDDDTGCQVDNIQSVCRDNPEMIVTEILKEWLKGKGRPQTWRSLIQTLHDCHLNLLADQIQACDPHVSSEECVPVPKHGDDQAQRSETQATAQEPIARNETENRKRCTLL